MKVDLNVNKIEQKIALIPRIIFILKNIGKAPSLHNNRLKNYLFSITHLNLVAPKNLYFSIISFSMNKEKNIFFRVIKNIYKRLDQNYKLVKPEALMN